jgi:hypothetical protein
VKDKVTNLKTKKYLCNKGTISKINTQTNVRQPAGCSRISRRKIRARSDCTCSLWYKEETPRLSSQNSQKRMKSKVTVIRKEMKHIRAGNSYFIE